MKTVRKYIFLFIQSQYYYFKATPQAGVALKYVYYLISLLFKLLNSHLFGSKLHTIYHVVKLIRIFH